MIEKDRHGHYALASNGERIPFDLEFRKRRRLNITVHPDMRVEVLAPITSSVEQVLTRVERRAGWIQRQRRFFEQYQPKQPDRRYVSGETYVYLGRQYRLKVRAGLHGSVKLVGKYLYVTIVEREKASEVKRLLDQWYLDHAQRLFAHRLQHCLALARSLGLPSPPRVLVRKMTRRWGSCSRSDTVSLNVDLVQVPIHCIDYVIMHELCHLRVHDHSPRFYSLLTRCMPDWRQRKARLEAVCISGDDLGATSVY